MPEITAKVIAPQRRRQREGKRVHTYSGRYSSEALYTCTLSSIMILTGIYLQPIQPKSASKQQKKHNPESHHTYNSPIYIIFYVPFEIF